MADVRLVRKGRIEPLHGLIQQARVSAGLARAHADKLAAHGWPANRTVQLEEDTALLATGVAEQAEARGLARSSTRDEHQAIDDAKAVIRKVRIALPVVLRKHPVAGVNEASFHADGPLRRSTPKIVAYLARIHPSVALLDEPLRSYLAGEQASLLIETARAKLERADTAQENATASLPQETERIYETKGRVLEAIEDLNRAGRIAYDGDALKRALFNKDLLLRARKHRGAPATPNGPDAPEPAPAG